MKGTLTKNEHFPSETSLSCSSSQTFPVSGIAASTIHQQIMNHDRCIVHSHLIQFLAHDLPTTTPSSWNGMEHLSRKPGSSGGRLWRIIVHTDDRSGFAHLFFWNTGRKYRKKPWPPAESDPKHSKTGESWCDARLRLSYHRLFLFQFGWRFHQPPLHHV